MLYLQNEQEVVSEPRRKDKGSILTLLTVKHALCASPTVQSAKNFYLSLFSSLSVFLHLHAV